MKRSARTGIWALLGVWRRIAQLLGKSKALIERWSAAHSWVDRVAALEARDEMLRREAVEEHLQANAEEHAAREARIQEKLLELREQAADQALAMARWPLSEQRITKENDEGVLSPGCKYRGQPRRHGTSWCHSTIRGIVAQGAYGGVHVVEAQDGPIERNVPAIVEPEMREKALSRLIENKRFSGGRKGHNYLLRGLPICEHCGTAYVGNASGRYHKYYACRKQRVTSDKQSRELTCPRIRADWLEELVWTDVRGFLEHPGQILSRVRSQLEQDEVGKDLGERHRSLTKRLAAKQTEKDRYVKLYAQGLIDDDELEVHLSDLKNQVDNLRMLIASVESDLAQKRESTMVAESTEAWLLTLRKNLADVERDTEEAFAARRELTNLLVERIVIGRDEEGRPKADITYRFGPSNVADGVRNSEAFHRAHGRGGAGGLLTGHPRMSSYSVAVERAPEARPEDQARFE